MSGQDSNSDRSCYYFYFGLIVTGKGEREHITKLFRSLMSSGICTFEVIGFIGQRNPQSKKQKLKMVGSGKNIPDKDANEIGITARKYLKKECSYVILLDDLEYDRHNIARDVFDRYRQALDAILKEQKNRASVHFLVNMLEAYYLADAAATNAVLGTSLNDYKGDVETIRNPKSELNKLYPNFREVRDGGEILDCLDVEKVLSNPDTCASLRTLFAWCLKVLEKYSIPGYFVVPNKYCLENGKLSEITSHQLNEL